MICVKIDKNKILTTTTTTVGIQKPDMSYFRMIEKKAVMEWSEVFEWSDKISAILSKTIRKLDFFSNG